MNSSGVAKRSLIDKRRLRVIIEKDFQYRFTLKLCLWGGLIIVAFGALFLFSMKTSYSMLIDVTLTKIPSDVANLERELRLISATFILCIVIMIGGLFGLGLVISQKLVGPIVALQNRLRDLAEGRRGVRLRLRKDDEFHSVEDVFNKAMESLEHVENQKLDTLMDIYFDLVNRNTSSAQDKMGQYLETEGRLAKN